MRDVADLAGVALTTVSRAFSAPEKVSPETLRRIESASRDLNYTINLNARSLRRKSSGVVLVLLPDIGNPFFALVLKGIEETARSHDRVILVGDTDNDAAVASSYARQLEARSADALILLDGALPQGAPMRRRERPAYPVVAISERIGGAGVSFVGIDNRAAAADLVRFLGRLGHQRIAHISGPPGNILTKERLQGFRDALSEMSAPATARVVSGDFSIQSGRAAARRILAESPRPTAIFAANDEMAMGAIHESKLAGIRVPQDISVAGFDDIGFAEIYDPSITTIRQPRREMGRAAMELVIARLQGRSSPPNEIILGYELVERGSTGAPGAAPRTQSRAAAVPNGQAGFGQEQ